jgi:hypothetical protein
MAGLLRRALPYGVIRPRMRRPFAEGQEHPASTGFGLATTQIRCGVWQRRPRSPLARRSIDR